MPISTSQQATSTTAALVASGRQQETVRVIAKGAATQNCYFGGSGVTTTTGLPLLTTDTTPLYFELGPGDDLYVIAGGAGTVQILKTRQ